MLAAHCSLQQQPEGGMPGMEAEDDTLLSSSSSDSEQHTVELTTTLPTSSNKHKCTPTQISSTRKWLECYIGKTPVFTHQQLSC